MSPREVPLEKVNCGLCGSPRYTVVYKTYKGDISAIELEDYQITSDAPGAFLRIVRCTECGFIYANPRPKQEVLAGNYCQMADPLYLEEEKGRRVSARAILDQLQKFKKPGRLLDVGCSVGFLLDEAAKRGWEVYGVELSQWAVDYAREKLGIKTVFHGHLKDAPFEPGYFDAVLLIDSIEHLTEPKETLIRLRKLLKKDGLICINTPDIDSLLSRTLKARWWGVKQSHLYYFTARSLKQMLEAAGFFLTKKRFHARSFSLKYWLTKLKGYNPGLYRVAAFFLDHAFLRNRLVKIDLRDQLEIYARKSRKLEYLQELEAAGNLKDERQMRAIAVLPAYNAEATLKRTLADIPKESVDEIILVDDASRDNTVELARKLGLKVFVHEHNRGYGANQKTCYLKALEAGADIVVMVHPDYQYDPKVIPQLIDPIKRGAADAVFGSRMMKGGALEGGMPLWKHNANILLTALENVAFGTYLSEYHSGFRAYSAKLLKNINFQDNSDGFLFDTEIIVQILLLGFKIEEVPIRTRYFDEASTVGFFAGTVYGAGILRTIIKYLLHLHTFFKFRQFNSSASRQ